MVCNPLPLFKGIVVYSYDEIDPSLKGINPFLNKCLSGIYPLHVSNSIPKLLSFNNLENSVSKILLFL